MKRKAVWIICILTALFCGCAANARVIITLDQLGPNVVATGSGTVNFTDLTFRGFGGAGSAIDPGFPSVLLGGGGGYRLYSAIFGPTQFGNNIRTLASTGTGNRLGHSGGLSLSPTPTCPARGYPALRPGTTPPSPLSAQTWAPLPGPGEPARTRIR